MELARYVTAQRAQQPLGSLACHVSDSAPHAATSWQSSADGTLHNNLFSGDFSVQILENTHQLQTQDRRVLAVRPQQWKGCSDLLQTIVYDVGQASAIMTDPPPQKKYSLFKKYGSSCVTHTQVSSETHTLLSRPFNRAWKGPPETSHYYSLFIIPCISYQGETGN